MPPDFSNSLIGGKRVFEKRFELVEIPRLRLGMTGVALRMPLVMPSGARHLKH